MWMCTPAASSVHRAVGEHPLRQLAHPPTGLDLHRVPHGLLPLFAPQESPPLCDASSLGRQLLGVAAAAAAHLTRSAFSDGRPRHQLMLLEPVKPPDMIMRRDAEELRLLEPALQTKEVPTSSFKCHQFGESCDSHSSKLVVVPNQPAIPSGTQV